MNHKTKLDPSTASQSPLRRRLTMGAIAAIGAATIALAGVVSATPASISGIILLVGADASQRVVNWYASANTQQVVQVAPTSELQNGAFPAWATSYPAVVAANSVNGGFNGHAILDRLQENTVYSYRVGGDGAWSSIYEFKTRKFDGNFDFLFFGDPQIGSSGNVPKDQAGWEDTLKVALEGNPEAELLVSGGDQVETAGVETQWTAFLAPPGLRAVPWVATIGNHDVGSRAYEQHLWTPNTTRSAALYRTCQNPPPAACTPNQSGGDYWFIYKGVLFIDINSNAFTKSTTSGDPNTDSDTAHINYIDSIIGQHGDKAKYTVLMYHHSIYSPANHANDSDNKKRRLDFPLAFSRLGVDLVLQGHDHSYSRSYLIEDGFKQNPDERPGATSVFQGPGGVIYVTGNSASGSKYYELTLPTGGTGTRPVDGSDPLYGPDPLNPENHWANSVENQENVRSYVKVMVRNNLLSVENIRSGTCAAPNAAYEVGNVDTCGPDLGASPALPVGSLVDKVVIHPARH
jgi:Calcineurin-like phosphoesterase/Purple acid Phosphatase, N-terminal domain